jgi:hypothetical protein
LEKGDGRQIVVKLLGFCREDESSILWPGYRFTGAFIRNHGLCPWGSTILLKLLEKKNILFLNVSSPPPAYRR